MSTSVKIYQERTDEFNCEQGLRQDCIFSPTSFWIFINDIANKIEEFGRHGAQLITGLVELVILLFADDLALIASTPQGLQNQPGIFMETCAQLGVDIACGTEQLEAVKNLYTLLLRSPQL